MNNERKPLLSDSEIYRFLTTENGHAGENKYRALRRLRDHYERLITEGKLRVVEHASPVHKLSGFLCSICSISWQDDQYCRGCGNKIKP